MKTNQCLFNIRKVLWAVTFIGCALNVTLHAATNTPAPELIASKSTIFNGVQVYSIRFAGGTASEFFKFMRTNGFARDTILFAGRAGEIHIPSFTVSNVRLKEVARSIEFVAEGKLNVEIVEQGDASDVNVWRIKLANPMASDQLKTRACALPQLLAGSKGRERVERIVDEVAKALMEGAYSIYGDDARRPQGSIRILESEKIVVALGMEAYVEAVASALDAAERVVMIDVSEKKRITE